MSENQKFVVCILLIASAVVCTALFVSGTWAISVAVFICVLVWILRPLVMPAGYGANKIRTLCVMGAIGLSASWGGWSASVTLLASSLVRSKQFEWLPEWIKAAKFDIAPPLSVLIFVYLVMATVLFLMRDKTIGGNHSTPMDKDFPEETFPQKLKTFCSILRNDLVTIDRQSNWNPEYYAELEAEVEVLSSHGIITQKKVLNLQEAIKVDRRLQSFLLLGVPGAGKSVALRKLALDMLSEVGTTKRVPIYINLREWVPQRIIENGRIRFAYKDLESFVWANITKNDSFSEDFLELYFTRLLQSGRLFFIFDSFDEISELLDSDQDDEVVDALSQVISMFIGAHPESKGILASRVFRRPTQAFLAQKVLEIRPLSEASILEGLSRSPGFSRERGIKLLRERRDLVPLIRNPFIMALLEDWVRDNAALPDSQAQIYEGYILKRLEKRKTRLEKEGVTVAEFMSLATEIAWFVFSSSSYGLEAPVRIISQHFNSQRIDSVLNILEYIRIARVTTGEDRSFAFVHRRFLEYFVTRRLLNNPEEAPISHIPTDSRGRDALVLYAQICDSEEAERIAKLCWREIKTSFDDNALRIRAIHCLRFLVDAFCSRRDAIKSFEVELHLFVEEHVGSGDSLILAKICLEATGLLPEMKTVPMLSLALSGGNDWLQETAFRACRHLPQVEKDLQKVIVSYLLEIPDLRFWNSRKGLLLGLSLSEALRSVHTIARLRVVNLRLSFIATLSLLVISPALLISGIFYALLSGLIPGHSSKIRKKPQKNEADIPSTKIVERASGFHLLRMSFTERLTTVTRYMTILAILAVSTMAFIGFLPANDGGGACLYSWCSTYPIARHFTYLLLATMLLDWVFFFNIIRKLAKEALTSEFWLAILIIALAASIIATIIGLAIYSLSAYEKYIRIIFFGILLIIALFGAGVILREWMRILKDHIVVNAQVFSNKVTRLEISDVMSKLLTDHGRLRYVRRLEVERVGVTGQWPEHYKLAVGLGEPITALARLEERWLGLDR